MLASVSFTWSWCWHLACWGLSASTVLTGRYYSLSWGANVLGGHFEPLRFCAQFLIPGSPIKWISYSLEIDFTTNFGKELLLRPSKEEKSAKRYQIKEGEKSELTNVPFRAKWANNNTQMPSTAYALSKYRVKGRIFYSYGEIVYVTSFLHFRWERVGDETGSNVTQRLFLLNPKPSTFYAVMHLLIPVVSSICNQHRSEDTNGRRDTKSSALQLACSKWMIDQVGKNAHLFKLTDWRGGDSKWREWGKKWRNSVAVHWAGKRNHGLTTRTGKKRRNE